MPVVQVQVRWRTRIMRLIVPPLLVTAVLTPSVLMVVWLTAGRHPVAVSAAGIGVVVAVGRVLLTGPPTLVRRVLAGRPALDELLPAELWAQLFVLPIATVAVSALSSAALTMGSLTVGEAPVLDTGWRVYALLALLLSASIAVIVPVGAAYRAVRQRAEDEVRIFDDTVPDELHGTAMQDQWRELRTRPRWWLSDRRIGALGTELLEPSRAWPSRWRSTGGCVLLAPVAVLSCLSVAAIAGLLVALAGGLPGELRFVGGIVGLLALPGLAASVDVYRLLLIEQSRADVLRAARSRRDTMIARRPSSEPLEQDVSHELVANLSSLPRRDLLRALLSARPRA